MRCFSMVSNCACGNSCLVDVGVAAALGAAVCAWATPMASDAASTASRIVFLVIAYILSSGRKFVRGVGAYRKRMHRMRDEVAHAIEHRAMAREPRKPRKLFRHDQQRKVAPPGRRTCMAGVLCAVVRQFEDDRRERSQALLECAGY